MRVTLSVSKDKKLLLLFVLSSWRSFQQEPKMAVLPSVRPKKAKAAPRRTVQTSLVIVAVE